MGLTNLSRKVTSVITHLTFFQNEAVDEKRLPLRVTAYFADAEGNRISKEGANVPVYVLEYLLGMYCATDDEDSIEQGVQRVKDILADNFVRPDEAEKIKSKIREMGSYTVIDKVEARLDADSDTYRAMFSNLGLKNVVVDDAYIKQFEKLLAGGIWCILRMNYSRLEDRYDEYDADAPKAGKRNRTSPFEIEELTPIQLPHMDMQEFFEGRKRFSKDEWIDVMLRSVGMEPTQLEMRTKWHLLARMIPLVENNYNLCELGPRGTGKSHIYKEISPNSILISGGQTTVANLFYNMASRTIGLVVMIGKQKRTLKPLKTILKLTKS